MSVLQLSSANGQTLEASKVCQIALAAMVLARFFVDFHGLQVVCLFIPASQCLLAVLPSSAMPKYSIYTLYTFNTPPLSTLSSLYTLQLNLNQHANSPKGIRECLH